MEESGEVRLQPPRPWERYNPNASSAQPRNAGLQAAKRQKQGSPGSKPVSGQEKTSRASAGRTQHDPSASSEGYRLERSFIAEAERAKRSIAFLCRESESAAESRTRELFFSFTTLKPFRPPTTARPR